MRDLLDMLELDPPQDQEEEEAFQHFSYLYIKYVQIYKNLEDCYDQHVHPQKRIDIKEVLEAVIGRMLEIKQYLIKLSGLKFINFDDILVDLKLIPETLELPVPRYFVDERQKDLMLREKLVQTLIAAREAEKEEQPDAANAQMSIEECIRVIQQNERGRQGKQRARFMREIRKQEEMERKMREVGQPETDPDHAATVIQKLFRGYKTIRQARMMREEELVFIGMKEPEPKPRELDPMARQEDIRARRKILQAQNKDEYEEALVNIRRKIYDDEGVDMREQMMDKIRQWFVAFKEQNETFPDYPDEESGGSVFIFDPPPAGEDEEEDEEGGGKEDKKKDDKKKDDKKKGEEEEEERPPELPVSEFVLKMQSCTEKFCQVSCVVEESLIS
jgi:IQ and AAA domain-containing protein